MIGNEHGGGLAEAPGRGKRQWQPLRFRAPHEETVIGAKIRLEQQSGGQPGGGKPRAGEEQDERRGGLRVGVRPDAPRGVAWIERDAVDGAEPMPEGGGIGGCKPLGRGWDGAQDSAMRGFAAGSGWTGLDHAGEARLYPAHPRRGHSSVGRAPEWHSGGRRFDSDWLHQWFQ